MPDATRLLAVPAGIDAATLAARIAGEPRVVLALIGADADSRAVLAVMQQAVAGACWRPAADHDGDGAFDRAC